MSFTFNSTFTVIIKQSGFEIKTSPKLTNQYMPLSGLSQFPFNSTSKNSTQNAPKLAFFSSKIEKFSGEGAAAPRPRAFGASIFAPPPAKNSGGTHGLNMADDADDDLSVAATTVLSALNDKIS